MLFNHDCHFKNFWFLKIHFIASQIIRTVHKFRCVFAYTSSSFKLVHLVGFVGYQFPFQLDALYICDSQCGMYTCMESVWQMKLNYFKCIISISWIHCLKLISYSWNFGNSFHIDLFIFSVKSSSVNCRGFLSLQQLFYCQKITVFLMFLNASVCLSYYYYYCCHCYNCFYLSNILKITSN